MEAADAAAAPKAATVHPVKQTWQCAIDQPGQIEAFEETPIYANVAGFISEVCVDMNARVKKGDVLARMAIPEMDKDLKQKTALIAQAEAELEQARKAELTEEASLNTATARVGEAHFRYQRALANLQRSDSENKRIEKLLAKQLTNEETRDEVRFQYKAAEAEAEEGKAKIHAAEASVLECEARRNKAKADVRAAAARLSVARVNEERAAAMLNYATLTAPFDGVVTERNVHSGHLVKPAANGKDEPLFVVVRTDRVRIFVDVPETEAAYVQPGTAARVRIHALKDREIQASVIRISWRSIPRIALLGRKSNCRMTTSC